MSQITSSTVDILLFAILLICFLFYSNANSLRVLVGTVSLSDNNNNNNAYHRVSRIIVHRYYSSWPLGIINDIALLQLTNEINFNTNTNSITLAKKTPSIGTEAIAVGWGLNENNVIPNQLQYLRARTVSKLRCFIRNFPILPSGSQICAIADDRNAGICNGDSGSALIYRNTLIGIVSWGTGGCANGRPDGYTSVAGYRYWILDNMN